MLTDPRPYYTAALLKLAEIHQEHIGVFLGGNFIDCPGCHFHAHNVSGGMAEEHDGSYTFRKTYAVVNGELRMTSEWRSRRSNPKPTYGELLAALQRFGNVGLIATSGKTLDSQPSNCTCQMHPELQGALEQAAMLVRRYREG